MRLVFVAAAIGLDLPLALAQAPVPADFVENRGQWPSDVRFLATSGGTAAAVEDRAIALHSELAPAVRLTIVYTRTDARPAGVERRAARYNYFLGDDSSKWREGVPAFGGVVWRDLYDGIDMVVHRRGDRFEYDLVLAAGTQLDCVTVACEGATRLEISDDGALLLHTGSGFVRQTPPIAWEVLPDGCTREIECRFQILGPTAYGFDVAGRDGELSLVVDPGLEWSTFLGGRGGDFIGPVVPARDASGDVFVGGTTKSPDFPLFDDPTFGLPWQDRAFVARLDAGGATLEYATFFGGWHSQLVHRGLTVDAGGNAVLVGQTFSPDFPTTPDAFDPIGQHKDAFVVRLNPTGGLIFSTFLGGFSEDDAAAVEYDPAGRIVVGGTTSSSDFPTTPNAFDPTYNAPNAPSQGGAHGDMFLARLSADGSQLTYGTFLGGPQADVLEDLAIDAQGFVTVAGWVSGNDVQVFVTTPGAFDSTWNGTLDGAIARLKLDGLGNADLKYATLMGGASSEEFRSLAIDPSNSELVTFAGRTWSNDFPTTPGVVRPTNPPFSPLFPEVEAGMIARFRFPAAGGGIRVWSTYHHADRISSVAVNAAGQPIVVGPSAPWHLATTQGAFDRTAHGSGSAGAAFISRLSADATQYLYQSFFGGSGGEADNFQETPQVALVGGNTVVISGQTASHDFPVTPLAHDTTFAHPGNLGNDGFVTKIALDADASGDLAAIAPILVSPPNGATYRNGTLARLEWSAVNDPSGVESYEFQVSGSADFASNFITTRGAVKETQVLIPPSNGQSGGLSLTQHFWRVRTSDRAGNLSPWSAVRSFTISSSSGQPTISGIQVYPTTTINGGVPGGNPATGMIHLYDPAPAGGLVANLTVHHDRGVGNDRFLSAPVPISVPATVSFPAGAISAPFAIQTTPVLARTTATIVATIHGVGNQAHVAVMPPQQRRPIDIQLKPATIVGGNPVQATVVIDGPAPSGGQVVQLSSGHPQAATVPASVTVPAGARSVSFTISTSPIEFEIDATINSWVGGESYFRPLYVRPPNLPALTSMTLLATSIPGGGSTTGTIGFSGPIPLGTWPALPDGIVRFTCSDPKVAGVTPGGDYVLAGESSSPITVYTTGGPVARTVTIDASYNTVTVSRSITVGAVTGVTVAGLTANATVLPGGHGGVATVQLAAPAPANILIQLSTSHPNLFKDLPADLVVYSGSTTASFAYVSSTSASATTPVTVTASYGASAKSLAMTIKPDAQAVPPLIGLTLSQSSVSSGASLTGTVVLQGPSPSDGSVVQLSSWNSGVAVPSTVTIPPGATSASFPITTSGITSTTVVPIWAVLNLSAGAALTVNAGAGPPPVPSAPTLNSPAHGAVGVTQPITFDWNDTANAASYIIQVDDSSTLAAPFVRQETVTASQYQTSGLAVRRHWWRVRGVNSAGVAGAWSTVRRFDPVAAPSAPSLSSIAVNPATVVGGNGSTGTATLTSPAPSGGALVTLASNNTSAATTPASVTIPAGATTATFALSTSSVGANTNATISAVYAGITRTTTLTVTPQPAPASLNAISVSPSSVSGGSSSTGTVSLTSAAPSGGFPVALSSSNSSVASVPASVTVPAGATSASFSVSTSTVATSTSATLSATSGAITRTATLVVNAPPSGPLPAPSLVSPANDARFAPGQLIIFDWNNVSGAASYTIAIDDTENFSSPIVSPTTTSSTFSTSTLPTARMWWRVRANASDGSPGSWSASRRFEVKQ